jgi:hypothetical protein
MAGFKVHVTTSALCGVAYGAAGAWLWQLDWGIVTLAGGLCGLGGMMPDLDSESGVPLREMSGLAGTAAPFVALPFLRQLGWNAEREVVVLGAIYLFMRYGVATLFHKTTVHRGMFHSLPAMLIAGLAAFLLFHDQLPIFRAYIACGVMLGFLSHLVLDEIYAVDLSGLVPKLNQFAGSAMKFTSASWTATLLTYVVLFSLGWAAWNTLPGVVASRQGAERASIQRP